MQGLTFCACYRVAVAVAAVVACVFLSLCANVSLQILLKLHLEHVNIALRAKKAKTQKRKTPKKKGKTTNTTATTSTSASPSPLSYTLPFVFCHFLQCDFYYTLRFRFVSSRLVQFSYIYFACNSFPFIFTCIYRQTVPGICVGFGFGFFGLFPLLLFLFFPFTVRRCFLFYVSRSCFFLGLALDLDSVFGFESGIGFDSQRFALVMWFQLIHGRG